MNQYYGIRPRARARNKTNVWDGGGTERETVASSAASSAPIDMGVALYILSPEEYEYGLTRARDRVYNPYFKNVAQTGLIDNAPEDRVG